MLLCSGANESQKLAALEAEIKRLKAESRRVIEERNILKEPLCTLQGGQYTCNDWHAFKKRITCK